MYCSSCGTKLSEGAKFCPKCGAPVTRPAGAQPQQMEPPVQPRTQPRPAPKSAYQAAKAPAGQRSNVPAAVITLIGLILIIVSLFLPVYEFDWDAWDISHTYTYQELIEDYDTIREDVSDMIDASDADMIYYYVIITLAVAVVLGVVAVILALARIKIGSIILSAIVCADSVAYVLVARYVLEEYDEYVEPLNGIYFMAAGAIVLLVGSCLVTRRKRAR